MRRLSLLLVLLLGCGLSPAAGRAAELVADLSDHLVAVTTGFVGTRLLLFGAVEGQGDVIVVTRGPDRSVTVRRKDRVAGIWMNRDQLTFHEVPAFYAVAASRPLDAIASEAELTRHRIGLERLRVTAVGGHAPGEVARFHDALVRLKLNDGLYRSTVSQVEFLGTQLFRTSIVFPANVPTGKYDVAVFLLRGGQVVSAQTSPLFVSKIGIGATISDFAHDEAAAYGVVAILVALAGGWLAAVAFNRP